MATEQLIVSDRGILLPITGKRDGQYGVVIGHVLVADDDFTREELLIRYWHENTKGYAYRRLPSPSKKKIALHQVVFAHYHGPVPEGLEIDHIDRDRLNNLPTNLRAVTSGMNQLNAGRRRNNTSGFIDVTWNKRHCRWYAIVRIFGKKTYLGHFPTAREAADAVNIAWAEHYPHLPIPNP